MGDSTASADAPTDRFYAPDQEIESWQIACGIYTLVAFYLHPTGVYACD